jgi:hypothetical protein
LWFFGQPDRGGGIRRVLSGALAATVTEAEALATLAAGDPAAAEIAAHHDKSDAGE